MCDKKYTEWNTNNKNPQYVRYIENCVNSEKLYVNQFLFCHI